MIYNIFTDYRSPEIRGLLHSKAIKGYAKPSKDVVDVWAKPMHNADTMKPHAKDRNRSSQITKNDPSVEILSDVYDGWVLVRLVDGTIGWVEMDNLELTETLTRPHEPLLTSREFIERYLGVPYLLGGTTHDGIDCSGLTQRYYSQVRGAVIPRHSSDQWKAGKHVGEEERAAGDIVNLRHREKTVDHVAIFFNPDEVLHACLDRKGVALESIDVIQERYDILGTTRIL